jgi:L-ribulose-5-phosphate 3-epimerase UlaE
MTILDDIKLDNIDPEDFGDTLLKLEKSFRIKFADNSFKDAKTFGDICDIIESQINLTDKNDCTTQQAFYKVRKAIVLTQNLDERNIKLQTKLEDIFPRSNRRQNLKHFQQALGFSVDILTMKTWLAWTIIAGFILSLIAFFFSWQYAVAGLTFFILFTWAVNKFSTELDISTVGELTEKISREHYSLARRHGGTVNRKEITKTIQDVFIADHLIDRKHLTKDASLGWS